MSLIGVNQNASFMDTILDHEETEYIGTLEQSEPEHEHGHYYSHGWERTLEGSVRHIAGTPASGSFSLGRPCQRPIVAGWELASYS